jgi:hypothetical protein
MTDNKTNKVIVVLSPGRAGTSLLMKALGAMGMRLSENMIPGSVGNPEGFFEDAEIVEVHKALLQNLNTSPVHPLPDGWLESEPTKKARPKLRKILDNRLQESNAIWGFKDPRTASFLPLWNRILNAPGTVPVFILAVRDPAVVSASLKRQINREEVITELQWLQRTTDALYHTAADCYIIHFEDWFTRPFELAQGLLEYTGLNEYFNGDLKVALKDVIKPNLNRAVYDDYKVQNEYVIKLYEVLKDCREANFDRQKLIAVVKESRKAINGFKGWYLEEQKKHDRLSKVLKRDLEKAREQYEKRIKTLEAEHKRSIHEKDELIKELEQDLHKITLQNNEYLKQIKDLHDEKENLRVRLNSTQKQQVQPQPQNNVPANVKNLRKELSEVHNTYSYRLGQVFVSAVARPGKNTFMLPFRFTKIIIEFLFARK